MIPASATEPAETLPDGELRERIKRLDELLGSLESLPTAPARTRAMETTEALVELYGEGLARMTRAARASSDPGVIAAFVDDPLVAHLLLVHDLHPLDVEQRVALALESARPHLGGADARLVAVEGGVARVRLHQDGGGCGGGTEGLVEDAVYELAPELAGVVVERMENTPPQPVALGPTRHQPPSPGAP